MRRGTGRMSNLAVTQTSPLRYITRQAPLTASPRQTPRSIFPDTSVLGRIIPLISLLKHHLAMQRNGSARRRNERRARAAEQTHAVPGQARPTGSTSPPQITAPKLCSCQKEGDVPLTCEMQHDFSHRRQGMSPALSILSRELWFRI